MKHQGKNSDDFLREFTLVGLFLSLLTFLGNDLNSDAKNQNDSRDVLKTELQIDFDVLLSKHLSFPDLLSYLPIKLISSNHRADQTGFELFYQNRISVKCKVQNFIYLKFKSNINTFLTILMVNTSDPDRPCLL